MSVKKSILDNADDGLPALNHAVDLQKEAAKVGFDWPDIRGVAAKIHEELDEVLAEIGTDDNQTAAFKNSTFSNLMLFGTM